MPVTLPNLDDRSFDDLVAEGKRLIPTLAPSWTDHNASDPGIALIELFAYIAEMQIYRADRVTEATQQAFVRLLQGDPQWKFKQSIGDDIRDAVLALRNKQRAVTAQDFVELAEAACRALGASKVAFGALGALEAQAHCLPGYVASERRRDELAHMSVFIVLPKRKARLLRRPDVDLTRQLLGAIHDDLEPRCLLTTRLHVALPHYLSLRVRITVHVFADQSESAMRTAVQQRLEQYFDPLQGGASRRGWPLGRAVYLSDLYALLDGLEGVDHVTVDSPEQALYTPDPGARERKLNEVTSAAFVGIRLLPDELVQLTPFANAGSPLGDGDSWVATKRLTTNL